MEEIERIGHRVDSLVSDMADVKAEQKIQGNALSELKNSYTAHTKLIEQHITGDSKIISEFHPLMEPLKEIVQRQKIKEELKAERELKRKQRIKKLTILSLFLGITLTSLKIFSLF